MNKSLKVAPHKPIVLINLSGTPTEIGNIFEQNDHAIYIHVDELEEPIYFSTVEGALLIAALTIAINPEDHT